MLGGQRATADERSYCKDRYYLSVHRQPPPVLNPDLSQPLLALPVLFLGGVLTSLNPCIYPMIPITAAIVGGQEVGGVADPSVRPPRWRPVLLTLTYVLGLASLYSTLGVIAGMTGTLFGSISTNPWLYFLMANLLVLSALAMLDVLPVPVPRSWIDRASRSGTAGRFSGAFIMGAVSGLVAAPCGAPIMAVVLTWVSTTQSGLLGFLYLFVFSVGMCTLLVLVGLSSATLARLPRSGAWMAWVKRGFGFLMLGVAEYYLIKMGQLLI
ncbi:MAG TPA: cytochrome c biogenesis protein CcdA [Gemmatimonadaceae bacterium]|nr:cytochrome c biogenesis protein CcdA [Gemmatimonadaceae bacterium]